MLRIRSIQTGHMACSRMSISCCCNFTTSGWPVALFITLAGGLLFALDGGLVIAAAVASCSANRLGKGDGGAINVQFEIFCQQKWKIDRSLSEGAHYCYDIGYKRASLEKTLQSSYCLLYFRVIFASEKVPEELQQAA